MDKQPFVYTGTDARGGPMTGTVKAFSLEEAQALAIRLGCKNPMVTEYNPHAEHKQAIPDLAAGSVRQVSAPPQMLPARVPAAAQFSADVDMYEASPKVEDNSRLAAMVSGIKENVPRQIESANTKYRQTLIMGEQPIVAEKVETLLGKQHGRVISVNMHPNHHGIMMIAVVVEHEVAKEK